MCLGLIGLKGFMEFTGCIRLVGCLTFFVYGIHRAYRAERLYRVKGSRKGGRASHEHRLWLALRPCQVGFAWLQADPNPKTKGHELLP